MAWNYPQVGGQPVLDPESLAESTDRLNTQSDFIGIANTITCPVGIYPGSAWFLVPRSVVDSGSALDRNTRVDITWKWTLADDYDESLATVTTFKGYVIKEATCMGLDGDTNAAYLLEMRDVRQLLLQTTSNKLYNISYNSGGVKSYLPSSLYMSTTPWTWQEILADLWADLPGVAGSVPTLPFAPAFTPDTIRVAGGSTWEAIGQILDFCQAALCYDPTGDTFSLQRLGATQSGLATAQSAAVGQLILDYLPKPDCGLANIPESLSFVFPRRTDGQPKQYDSAYINNQTTGITGAQAGSLLSISMPLIAEYKQLTDTTPVNQTTCDAAAVEMANKMIARMSRLLVSLDQRYSSLVSSILPGCDVHFQQWTSTNYADSFRTEISSLESLLLPSGIAVDPWRWQTAPRWGKTVAPAFLVTIGETQAGNGSFAETQVTKNTNLLTSGTFAMSFDGTIFTAGLAYNCSASDMQTALNGLANAPPSGVTVTFGGGQFTIVWNDPLFAPYPLIQVTTTNTTYPNPFEAGSTSDFNPVYSVELGTVPWSERTVGGSADGGTVMTPFVPLKNEPRQVSEVFGGTSGNLNFVADSPTVIVRAGSTIGHLPIGTPVICEYISGQWYITGPYQVTYSYKEYQFAPSWYRADGSGNTGIGDASTRLTSDNPIGIGTLPTETQAVKPLTVAAYNDYSMQIKQSGDFKLDFDTMVDFATNSSLTSYLTSDHSSGPSVTTGPASAGTAHTHTVPLKLPFTGIIVVELSIETDSSRTIVLGDATIIIHLAPTGTGTITTIIEHSMPAFVQLSKTVGFQQGEKLRLCATCIRSVFPGSPSFMPFQMNTYFGSSSPRNSLFSLARIGPRTH